MLWLVSRRRRTDPPHQPFEFRRPLLDAPFPCVQARGADGVWISQIHVEDDGRPDRPPPMSDRPPYRIPTMDEVRAVPWNGLTVVSTFAGAGGSSTGYRMAGYRIVAAVEFVPAAQDTYAANMGPHTELVPKDVRDVEPSELLQAAGVAAGDLDVLDGSPPCEPFSSAGRRDKTWRQVVEYSGQRQRTDDLFFEFARLVAGLRPRAFVAENVEGLVRGRAKGYFKWIIARLRSLDYDVQARVLDASWLGVPQSRRRVIFIGVRRDLDQPPAFPAPFPYQHTVRDALPHVAGIVQRDVFQEGERFAGPDGPSPTVAAQGLGAKRREHVHVVGYRHDTGSARQGPGAKTRDRLDEPAPAITNGDVGKGGGSNASHHRLDEIVYDEQIVGNRDFEPEFGTLDRPHPTVTVRDGHRPRTSGELRDSATLRRRQFTIPELKRICGFPDDYELTGTFSQQWERLGDSVPPPMMKAVAETLRDGPLKPYTKKPARRRAPKPRSKK